jgi:hypothetical protein
MTSRLRNRRFPLSVVALRDFGGGHLPHARTCAHSSVWFWLGERGGRTEDCLSVRPSRVSRKRFANATTNATTHHDGRLLDTQTLTFTHSLITHHSLHSPKKLRLPSIDANVCLWMGTCFCLQIVTDSHFGGILSFCGCPKSKNMSERITPYTTFSLHIIDPSHQTSVVRVANLVFIISISCTNFFKL